jgi:ABC-type antimicrobial peptide transport system permease subunit
MQDIVVASPGVPERRLLTAAFTSFALMAVVLSAIGLFGVAAHDVASRRTEFALRIALGADSMQILTGALRQGALMVGSGLALGGLLSIWATRALSTTGIATRQGDFASASVAAVVLMVTGAAAMLLPARRALRTDCLIVLRGE